MQHHRERALRKVNPGMELPFLRVLESALVKGGVVDLVRQCLNILKRILTVTDSNGLGVVVRQALTRPFGVVAGWRMKAHGISYAWMVLDSADQD